MDRCGARGRRGPSRLPGHRAHRHRDLGGRAAAAAAPAGALARAVRPGPHRRGAQGLHGSFRGAQLCRPVHLCRPRGGGPRLFRHRAGPRPGHGGGAHLVPPAYARADPHRPGLLRGPGDRARGFAQAAGADVAEAPGDRRHARAAAAGGPLRRARGGGPMKETTRNAPTAEALPAKPQATDLSALLAQLSRLGLDFAAEALPGLLTRAVKEDLGPPALLGQLLCGELERREERRVRTSLKLSGLPTGQTLANFDFAFQPAVERSKLEALAIGAWLREKQGLLILGPPGVGKTHLAVALGVKAIESGFSVAFFRLDELLHAMRKDAEMPRMR